MKKFYPLMAVCCLALMATGISSCKKGDPAIARSKEQLIVGKWSINRIQVKVFYGTTLAKDSLVPQRPVPENFVIFSSNGTVEYRFNKPTSDMGTYTFVGTDSIHATIGGVLYRWKNLLLTETNFNLFSTSTNPSLPGATINAYQTFVR
jgi:hypothetical protein